MHLRIIIEGGAIVPLPPLEAAIMADLWTHGPSSVPAIARRIDRGATTISTTLYRMVTRGLVVNRGRYHARWAPTHDRATFERVVADTVRAALGAVSA